MTAEDAPRSEPAPRPRQKRSRETLRRILDALEASLESSTFEEVTVQEICDRAACSVGSFYGRVESKEGMLDLLRDRVYGEFAGTLPKLFDPSVAAQRPLVDSLRSQSDALVELHVRRRGVIRALIVQARRRSEFAEHTRVFNDTMLRLVSETWLARRDEIQHPDPEVAAQQAALMAAGYLREALVFGDLWPEQRVQSPQRYADLLFGMVASYLTGSAPEDRGTR